MAFAPLGLIGYAIDDLHSPGPWWHGLRATGALLAGIAIAIYDVWWLCLPATVQTPTLRSRVRAWRRH